jgi:uncharacterized protein
MVTFRMAQTKRIVAGARLNGSQPMKASENTVPIATATQKIERMVRDLIEKADQSVAHRMDHIRRVMRNAKTIAQSYPDADPEILALGVLLHDVEQPYHDKANHVSRSMDVARRVMREAGVATPTVDRVVQVIYEHSSEHIEERQPSSIEARILFDADKLDGVGASGILRVVSLFAQAGKRRSEAIPWYRHKIEVASANMQTPEGRALAAPKLKLVEAFLADYEIDLAFEEGDSRAPQ